MGTIYVGKYFPLLEKYQLDGQLVTSFPFREEEYSARTAEFNAEIRRGNLPGGVISAFVEEAYVPYGSDNVYMMIRYNQFIVVDSSSMEETRILNINYADEEYAIIPFCVIEPRNGTDIPTIYAIELRTGGIHKFAPRTLPDGNQ